MRTHTFEWFPACLFSWMIDSDCFCRQFSTIVAILHTPAKGKELGPYGKAYTKVFFIFSGRQWNFLSFHPVSYLSLFHTILTEPSPRLFLQRRWLYNAGAVKVVFPHLIAQWNIIVRTFNFPPGTFGERVNFCRAHKSCFVLMWYLEMWKCIKSIETLIVRFCVFCYGTQ